MLISHRKRFIYTKTVKTAGTSVESYFEPFCMSEGEWTESHSRDEYLSEAGIIGCRREGCRRENRNPPTWYNHMPAKRIRELIGEEAWESYFKFTVIRNPFDKMISAFFFKYNTDRRYSLRQKAAALIKQQMGRGAPIGKIVDGTEIERFRAWVGTGGGAVHDRDKYLIDGEECVDYFIRFEELHEGVRNVCERLSIPFDASRIPEFKKGVRHHRIDIRDYYDRETERIVRERYGWEIDRFGYDLP